MTERQPAIVDQNVLDATELFHIARQAHDARDWARAAGLWQRLRDARPDDPWPFCHGAVALRECGDRLAAEGLIEEAILRFPDVVIAFVIWAEIPVHRRDWAEADCRWRELRRRFPLDGHGYVHGAHALEQLGQPGEADRILTEGRHNNPRDPWIMATWGYFAQHHLDAEEALRRFADMRTYIPDHPAGYVAAAATLRGKGRFVEAEAMLAGALARFPGDAGPLMDYASIAQAKGDRLEEAARWAVLRGRFPDQLAGYVNGASALRAAGQVDEANALADRALAHFHNKPEVSIEFAWAARNRQDWHDAERRWATVRERLPDNPLGFVEGTQTFLFLGRIDEADELITAAREKFTDHHDVMVTWAGLAMRRRDFETATARWQEVRERFPASPPGYTEGGQALLEVGRIDDAEALLNDGRLRFPELFAIAQAWANVAMRRALWDEAIQRWTVIRQSFPTEISGYVGASRAMQNAGRTEDAERLLVDATERFPAEPSLYLSWSELASQREDWIEAYRRWQQTRERFPRESRSWVETANALRNLRRIEEADALLEAGMGHFPDNVDLVFSWALHAGGTKSSDVALARWQLLRDRFPNATVGYVFGAYAFQDHGLSTEAESLIADALVRFPAEMEVARAAAEIAARRGELALAATRFGNAARQYPRDLSLTRRWADILISLLQLDEARPVLDMALRMWPNDVGFLRSRVMLDVQTGQVESAFAVWRVAMNNAAASDGIGYELAWAMFAEDLPADLARDVLLFLVREPDTGDRHWQPQLAKLQHLRGIKPHLAHFAIRVLQADPHVPCDTATMDVLRSALLFEYTDDDLRRFFRTYVANGRLALTAFLFCQNYWKAKKNMFERFTAAFEEYMAGKHGDPLLVTRDNATELLAYLNFAAVHSDNEYAWLIEAMRQRLDLVSMQASGLHTVEGAVGNIALLARIDPLPAPAMLSHRRRLRIALCVSGQLRGYKHAFPTWSNLEFDQHETSVYVHVWKAVGRNWQRIWFFSRSNPFLWGTLVGPGAMQFLRDRYPRLAAAAEAAALEGSEASVEELQSFYGTPFVRIEDDQRDQFNNKTNLWKMHYKIEQAQRLALEDGREFDLMVRLRPDREMLPATDLDWGAIHSESLAHRVVFTDSAYMFTERQTWIGDQFAVGTQDVMNVYCGAFSDMESFARSGKRPLDLPDHLRPHTNMFYLCFYRGLLGKTMRGAGFGELLDPAMLSVSDVLALTLQDVAGRTLDDFDRQFIGACELAQPRLSA